MCLLWLKEERLSDSSLGFVTFVKAQNIGYLMMTKLSLLAGLSFKQ
jgi:hypothetical protein